MMGYLSVIHSFFLFSMIFDHTSSTDGYGSRCTFKIETIASNNMPSRFNITVGQDDENYLLQLKEEDRDDVCNAAKDFAKVDGAQVKSDSQFIYRSYVPKYTTLVKCHTIPVLYLYLRKPEDDVMIYFKENLLLVNDCQDFDFQKVELVPMSRKEILALNADNFDIDDETFNTLVSNLDGKKLGSSPLARVNEDIRLDLCLAAKTCISKKHAIANIAPILLTDRVKPAEVFKIDYKDRTEERVAIRCPTSPLVYVLFKNLRVNKNFLILYAVENAKPNPTDD